MKMSFQKVNGEKIGDVAKYVKDYINADIMTTDFQIFIGCDSLPKRKYGNATYVVTICIYKTGHGAHIIFCRQSNVKTYSLKQRLWQEVYNSIDAANEIVDGGIMEMAQVCGFEIHLDLNESKMYGSSVIKDEALAYVRNLGYDVFIKPDSPAASYAADRVCRGKEEIGVEV